MAFKLTKKESRELQERIDDYERAREALSEKLDEIASEWEEAFGEKSDKWQEGDAGQLAQERIDTMRGWHDDLMSNEFGGDVDALL